MQWTIASRFTVNVGLRTERESVPAYAVGDGIPQDVLDFNFGDKLAPRIGFAYDVKGNGRTKVFGNWGMFYDIFKLELPRGSFGGDKWWDYVFTLDTPNWPTLVDAAGCPPACPGRNITGGAGYIDYRQPSLGADAIDPDLKPMKQQEASAGVEHQLNDRMAVSARYVHKQIDRAVEDTGFITPDGHEGYVIANPGEGLTQLACPGVNLPTASSRLRQRRVRVREAIRRRTGTSAAAICGAACLATTPGCRSRTRTGAPARTSAGCSIYPTMMFDEHGQPVYGRAAHRSSAPVQDAVHLSAPHRDEHRLEPVRGERRARSRATSPSSPATATRCSTSAAAATDGRDVTRRPICCCSTSSGWPAAVGFQFSLNVLNLFDQQAVTSVHTRSAPHGVP